VIGNGDTVTIEDMGEGATAYQPEPEFAYVIGKNARYVKQADALDYVFGYMNFVDVSARGPGVQGRRTTFLHKGLQTWAPMGPAIVTKDEYPDPQALNVKLWLNGELRQDYTTGDMAHIVTAQIAWLTQFIELEPGDIVSCGTHHRGLSNINDGDVFKMEVEDFGPLECSVRSYGPPKTEVWAPPGTKKSQLPTG
jgi:2-keto-4-pentenoate hydratase/2-oxohepta-3-ene-1,7-dioic acid hydratase in catechol pathway